MPTEYVKTLNATVNPYDNGGETVTISVDIHDNGDGLKEGMFTNTSIETICYGTSSAKITIWGPGFESLAKAVNALNAELDKIRNG